MYLKGLNVLTVFLMREDSSEKEKILQVVHENQYWQEHPWLEQVLRKGQTRLSTLELTQAAMGEVSLRWKDCFGKTCRHVCVSALVSLLKYIVKGK